VQLSDCRIETRDEEPLALTSHESKAIESLERIGHFEISTAKFFASHASIRPATSVAVGAISALRMK
jgi:hypothetical protein